MEVVSIETVQVVRWGDLGLYEFIFWFWGYFPMPHSWEQGRKRLECGSRRGQLLGQDVSGYVEGAL